MSVIIKLLSKFDDSGLRKAKSGFSGLTKSLGAVGIGIGISQITNALTESIQAASNLSEQTAAVGQVFGSAAGNIQQFAAGAATSLGQSTVQILEASKSFGIFGKAAGLSDEALSKFTTDFVTLATDLASFNNTSVDESLVALQAGLRGESEPLRRYGVLLNDATLRQEALSLGIIGTTKNALTPQQKILAAQSAIYKQTSIQQGDFGRTSEGLANQQRILTASFDNAKATLGEALLPTFTKFVTYLNENVIPSVQTFLKDLNDPSTGTGKTFLDIKEAVESTINGLKDFFALFGNGDAVKGFGNIAKSLIEALPALIALKGIMMLAAGGKAISSLVTAITLIQGKSPVSAVDNVTNTVPLLKVAAASQLATLGASTAAQNTVSAGLAAKGLNVNIVSATFTGSMALPYDPSNPLILGGKRAVPNTTNNITINATNADPKAVVDAVGKYIKQNGSLPFNFTNGKAGR
jgi:hypothetical protein